MARPRRDPTGVGPYLCELLANRDRYRALWEDRVRQPCGAGLSQAAVARVVADHLVDTGERHDTEGLHRQIKDRVARLVSRGTVSAETLDWLIGAFGIDSEHAEQLWRMFRSDPASGYTTGTWPPRRSPLHDQGVRTVSLHELHTLGPDGAPRSHRTVQVVRAVAEPVTSYLYRFDTNALHVDVLRGGHPGPVIDLGDGLYAVEILFPEPLQGGGTWSLEYETTFRYIRPPAPEFRRGVINRMLNIELRVQFHPDRLPRQVWWGSWPDLDGPMSSREPAHLNSEHAVDRYLDGVEASIIGFAWEWRE